jgi:hypothetical protein
MENDVKSPNQMSEEEQSLREEVFAEIFNENAPETAAEHEDIDYAGIDNDDDGQAHEQHEVDENEQGADEDTTVDDPMAGIPPALREQIEGISNRLNTLGTIEERLKQTERRIGSIQNEFHAAKQAASEEKDKAPSKEEMADASKSKEAWDELKDDFPEWAEAIESKLAANSAELSKKLPDMTELKETLLKETLSRMQNQQGAFISNAALEERLLSFKHPDWKETVKGSEYQAWIKEQPQDVQEKHYNGQSADEATFVLDRFKEFQSTGKSPQEIAAARKKRLKQAETKTSGGRRQTPQKSESDMSEDEIREIEFAKIWG